MTEGERGHMDRHLHRRVAVRAVCSGVSAVGQRPADAGRPSAAGAAAAAAGGAVRRAVCRLGCAPGAARPSLLG